MLTDDRANAREIHIPARTGTAFRVDAGAEIEIVDLQGDRKSTRLNSSHIQKSRMPSSA